MFYSHEDVWHQKPKDVNDRRSKFLTLLAAVRTSIPSWDESEMRLPCFNFEFVNFHALLTADRIQCWIRAESYHRGRGGGGMRRVWNACVKFQMIDSNMLCALRRSPWFLPWGRNVLSLPRSWPANRETDFAAQATSTTHNQSLAFSLVLSPKRRPSQTTSIILLWFLSSLISCFFSFFFFSPFHFSFPFAVGKVPSQFAAWSSAWSLRFCLVTIYFI